MTKDLNFKRAGNCKKVVEKVPKFDSLKGHNITYITTRIRLFFFFRCNQFRMFLNDPLPL